MRLLYDQDADLGIITSRKVVVVGYGSQGHAQAQNLRDSGVKDIKIGLRMDLPDVEVARNDGFEVLPVAAAAADADVLIMLTPDEFQAEIYHGDVAPYLPEGAALGFSHGLNIHFNLIDPRPDLDVFMVAPKAPGHLVRSEYALGRGVPCLLAIEHDRSGNARDIGLAYAAGIGGGRAGIFETSFKEEVETDLFGEQAVLCGGLVELMTRGFDTLTSAGYAPEIAYFECIHEMKLVVDLIYEGGIAGMNRSISNTAEYGEYVSGPRLIDDHVAAGMRSILADIQSGQFAKDWMLENRVHQTSFKAMRNRIAHHPAEEVGRRLRGMMPWMTGASPRQAAE